MKEKRVGYITRLPSVYQCVVFTEDGKKVAEHIYPRSMKAELIEGKRNYDERYDVTWNLALRGETL